MGELLTVAPSLDTTNKNVLISATGLPAGETINPLTGVVGGTPRFSQDGTMAFTATAGDGTTATLSMPFSLAVNNDNSNPPDPYIDTVDGLLAEIVTDLVNPKITEVMATRALKAFYKIICIIVRDPSEQLMDLLAAHMTQYANSAYVETTFLLGMAYLPREESVIIPVYTAFRQITTNPTGPRNTDTVLRATGCWPLVDYIQDYGESSTNPVYPVITPVPANTVTPTVYTYANGAAPLYAGATAYTVNVSGNATVTLDKDPNGVFPSGTFFTESTIYLAVTSGTLTLDSSVKLSANAKTQWAALPNTGSYALILKVNSFDSGKTFVITSVDEIA